MRSIILTVLAFMALTSMSAQNYKSGRPDKNERLFRSEVVEKKIVDVASQLTNKKLAWMFTNCFPNTLQKR